MSGCVFNGRGLQESMAGNKRVTVYKSFEDHKYQREGRVSNKLHTN